MELLLLGTLEVRNRDGPVRLPARKQRALLALLALNANRVVARARLMDGLWGDEPPETAVKALQVYVSQLRKLLPAGALVTQPPGYRLQVEPDAVDLQRFERLVADARVSEPAEAAASLREALDLWRGPPLAEFGEEPFARFEAGRLEDMRLAALEERVEADLDLGRHAELVGELEALIAQEPQRERLRKQLMLALYRSGRQTEALEAFREARAALDELGLEPGVALRQLERQILTQDPRLELPAGTTTARRGVKLPGPLVPEPPFPFVGRADELTTLFSLLDRAVAGEGSLVLLAGDAGGGKTRLVRELAYDATKRGVLVLYGGSDAAVSSPYQPLCEWLDFLLRALDPEALRECFAGAEALARLVPELEELTGPPPPRDPESDRSLLQRASVGLLRRVSDRQPVLVVADDAHWADSETLHLLRRLARIAPEARLLVVAAYRDRGGEIGLELADALADLSRSDAVTRLTLGNLGSDDLGRFVRVAASAEASPELLSAFAELTDGTPLLVCELWRELLQLNAVEISDAGVRLTRRLSELQGLDRVRDAVRARLQRLAPPTVTSIELAAVAGPRFELRVLAKAGRLERSALVVALDEAASHGIVEDLPKPAAACRFTHELVRRAVYDGIPGMRRAELHLRVGEALEHVHRDDPARVLPELAHHFTLAAPVGGAERAIEYNLRAADAAITAVAFPEAAARLSSALELGIRDRQERARVQAELSYLLREIGRPYEARSVLAAAVDETTGPESRAIAAQLLLFRDSATADPASDPAQMQATMERAMSAFRELGDSRGLAIAGTRLGLALRIRGQVGDSCAVLERALVDAGGHRVARGDAIGTLAKGLCRGPAPVPLAIRRCEELLESDAGDGSLAAIIERCLSALLAMAGRVDDARELLGRSSPVLERGDQPIHRWLNRVVAAEAKELVGDQAGAEDDLTAAWHWFVEHGRKNDARGMETAYLLAHLYCDDGRWDDAKRCLEYGVEVPVPEFFRIEAVLGLATRARVAARDGEFADAVALATRAVELADRSDMLNLRARVRLALGEVQQASGAAEDARASVAGAIELYEQKQNIAAVERLGDRNQHG